MGSDEGWPKSICTNMATPESPHGAATCGAIAMNIDDRRAVGAAGLRAQRRAGEVPCLTSPFFFTWTAQHGAKPLELTGGEGAWFTTSDGGRWLDLGALSYQVNVGHGNNRIVDAIKRQADELCLSAPNAVFPAKIELAKRLLAMAGPQFSKVFFTLGGAEANENALEDRAALHRPPQEHRALSQLSRRVDGRDRADRRLAAAPRSSLRSPAWSTCRTATAIAVRSASASRPASASARRTSAT